MQVQRLISNGTRVLYKVATNCNQNVCSQLQPSLCRVIPLTCRTMATQIPLDPMCKKPVYHPKKGDLIYAGPSNTTVFLCKAVSLGTCVLSAALQPYLYMIGDTLPVPLLVAGMGSLGFFMFGTTALMHFVTKRYITYIYFNRKNKTFTAGRFTFFLRNKEMEYTTKDVVVPDVAGIFTTLKIKGKPFMAFDEHFLDYDVFIHMLGYDKPMKWKFKSEIESEKEKE